MPVVSVKFSQIIVNIVIRFVRECHYKVTAGMVLSNSNFVESNRTDCRTNAAAFSFGEAVKPAVGKLESMICESVSEGHRTNGVNLSGGISSNQALSRRSESFQINGKGLDIGKGGR